MKKARRVGRIWARAVLLLGALAMSIPAVAQTTAEPHLWTGVSVQGRVGHDSQWRWNAEAQVRTSRGAGAVDLVSGWFSATRTLTRRSSAAVAYAYGESYPASGTEREHRLVQQYAWTVGGDWRLSFRTRVEERFISGSSAVNIRMRQRIRASWPLAGKGQLRGVVSDEMFVTATPVRAIHGVNSHEVFVGVEQRVTPRHRIELGYAHVLAPRAARSRRHSHVLSTTFVVSL